MIEFRQREVKGAVRGVGRNERVLFTLTTTRWMTAPESATAKIYEVEVDGEQLTDVTATRMTGACSIDGDVITLPVVFGLEVGRVYLVEVVFVKATSTLSAVAWVMGEW